MTIFKRLKSILMAKKNKNVQYKTDDTQQLPIKSDEGIKNPNAIKIKGVWSGMKLFVNGESVSIDESLKHYHYADSFSWGDYSGETKQAALSILLHAKAPYPGYAVMMFKYFTGQILSTLPQADFEIEYAL